MPAGYLEVWTPNGRGVLALEGERVTIGADPANDVVMRRGAVKLADLREN